MCRGFPIDTQKTEVLESLSFRSTGPAVLNVIIGEFTVG